VTWIAPSASCCERAASRHMTRTSTSVSNVRGSKGDFKTAFADLDLAVANADPTKRLALLYNSGRLHLMARENRWVIDHYAALIKANPDSPRNPLVYL
jgi:hypothetical protein